MSIINIRKIEQSDNKDLAKIIREVFIEYGAPKKGTVYSDPTTDELSELFKTDRSALFIVEKDKKLLGCCGIYPTNGLPEDCVEVVKFYLLAEGRGKGLGKALFEKCKNEAIELGFSKLYLESTPEFKEAIGLYKKLGFTQLNEPLGESGHFGCNIWFLKTL